jgi:hypothetical protein
MGVKLLTALSSFHRSPRERRPGRNTWGSS